MTEEFSTNNEAFSYLKNFPEFLNSIINDVGSCILLLNKDMELRAFNDPMRNLFINKKDEDLLYERCGDALGCAYAVEEKKHCGETSKCSTCDLRKDAIYSYVNKEAIYNKSLSREFYKTDSSKTMRHLRYSVRTFNIKQNYYIMMIINDVTTLTNQNQLIIQQENVIKELESKFSSN